MTFDPERHHRRSIRLPGYDYRAAGWYFVTICVVHRECVLGTVSDGEVDLSAFGHLAELSWLAIPSHFEGVALDAYVVMPNHLHGIIVIGERRDTTSSESTSATFAAPVKGSLGTIIGSFKSAATRAINEVRDSPGVTVWQRNYH